MTVKLYKMARVECDDCSKNFFDVYTHEDYAAAPVGWKLFRSYGWGSGYSRDFLCCPECAALRARDKESKEVSSTPDVKLKDGWTHDG